MADIKQMRIFCAEQIEVPPELPEILKNYSKEVIRNNPKDLIDFSRKYWNQFILGILKPCLQKEKPKKIRHQIRN
jgi:hypothetical protein